MVIFRVFCQKCRKHIEINHKLVLSYAHTEFRKRDFIMSRNIRIIMSVLVYGIGLAAAIYVGGWIMIIKPLKGAIAAHVLGTLTLTQIIVTLVKCISSATVAGLIWCLGYIASNRVFDERDEE